mmetsp:Transcript_102653/g.319890  ORF Transcript_102653/g.319890 Transcript_102653/m.319890 type:complete len:255 (+) Transcript_102653:85-849(+)
MGCMQSATAANAAEDIVVTASMDSGSGAPRATAAQSAGAGPRSLHAVVAAGRSGVPPRHAVGHSGAAGIGHGSSPGLEAGPQLHFGPVGRTATVPRAGAAHSVRRLLVLDPLPPSAGGPLPFGEFSGERPMSHTFPRPRPGLGPAPELAHFMLQYRDLRPEDFDLLSKLDEGVPRRGTAPLSLVERLPRVRARASGSAECGVCLAGFASDIEVVQLPCRHSFHTECISKWLTEFRSTCPLCATSVKVADGDAAA